MLSDIHWSFKLLFIIWAALLLSACCPYAFKCSPKNALAEAVCTDPIRPIDKSFKAHADALGANVKLYRECQAVCVKN